MGTQPVDGGFVDLEDIATLESRGVKVYAPPKDNGGREVKDHCKRGAAKTEAAKEIYKERAATAECVNA